MSWFCAKLTFVRASRLLSILMLLQSRGRLSAAALAALLQVSVRTIHRDIDQLSAAGVPIWAETGRLGGICLREGWRTELTGLTGPEARAVVLSGLPGPGAELGLGEAMTLARLKLLAALPPDARGEAHRMAQTFHLDPGDWYRSATAPPFLRAIADAVWHGRRVEMRYASWTRVSDQTVDPLGLVLKAGVWYMAARAPGRAEVRVYRLDNVQALKALTQTFSPPRGWELATWWRERAAQFEAGLRTGRARLRVTEEGFARLSQFDPGVASAALDHARPCEREGWIETEVPIESVRHAAQEFLRLGDQAEVLSPAPLRAAMRGTARRMLGIHADPS